MLHYLCENLLSYIIIYHLVYSMTSNCLLCIVAWVHKYSLLCSSAHTYAPRWCWAANTPSVGAVRHTEADQVVCDSTCVVLHALWLAPSLFHYARHNFTLHIFSVQLLQSRSLDVIKNFINACFGSLEKEHETCEANFKTPDDCQ